MGTLGEQASRLHFMLSSIDDQLKQVFDGTTEDEKALESLNSPMKKEVIIKNNAKQLTKHNL